MKVSGTRADPPRNASDRRDKVNMSVAIIPMSLDCGWSAGTSGLVQASFFWGPTPHHMDMGMDMPHLAPPS
ncbi:MFS domain-containing protein [Haematococcus lacustris]|uniref:MFS domain-containing protein n=1 Tax=Haematococcus lacustris TaxID=44745 RepID=A0A699Z0Z2_HAELA|nr:MFS domain-containing protein [Haematococcus lacustris]